MIRVVIIIVMSLGALLGFTQEATKYDSFDIVARVSNTQGNKGKVYYALYKSQETMNSRKPLQFQRSIIEEGISTVTFKNISKGVYALVCYHDANDNNQIDFGDNGRPIEDYGTSNRNASFGPPLFEDSKFEVSDTNLTFDIQLIKVR